ncbi:MAG: DUF883 domain-containing protein [Lonepinella koalarum]|nr:DUF883 domain-containing protein [Lonepinella koalarum]
MSKNFGEKKQELLDEIRDILTNAEELFDEKSKADTDELKKLKSTLNSRVKKVKAQITSLQDETIENAKQIMKEADSLVQENPYRAVGIAGVIGLLLGVLISRR